jgi:predicted neuraminidase
VILPPAIVRSEFIYNDAPFPSCHASTIVETTSRTLVAAWFGGTAESNPDTAIYVSRQEGEWWSKPAEAANGVDNGKRFACYNPVLVQQPKGPLILFYKYGTGPQTWKGRMASSDDGGVTWSAPRNLPEGIFGPIKNKPFILGNTMLCGSSTEDRGWRVHFESTSDWGKTWQTTAAVNDPQEIGAIQPTILPMSGTCLKAIGRTQQGRIFAIDSPDNGKSWGKMRLLEVPNPNSGTDAVHLKDGRYLLAYNNTTEGRSPLNIAVSKDAEHWQPAITLEEQPGEFSYPAIIQTADGLVHVTYTWNRHRIRHVVLDPRQIP